MTPGDHVRAPLARDALDRAAAERADESLLHAARADPATRVLVLHADAAPLAAADALHYVAPGAVPAGAEWAFLGRRADGAAVLLAAFDADAAIPFAASSGWGRLRTVGGALGALDAATFVQALSLGRWLLDSPFCPACGSCAQVRSAGWSRVCPACAREHFPRTDPAVIVAVTSSDGQRLLLGSNALWGQDRYSCFAGFVEAGESLEQAVHREVAEECGVRLDGIRFAGSQAWPYPRSLMVGFHARCRDDTQAQADGEEIVQVRWFTRSEVAAALDGGSEFALPAPASIAHALILGWLGGEPT